MKMNALLLLVLSLVAFSVAEEFVKVEGTSGEYSDIVVDSYGGWYIIKDKTLYFSSDKGVTLNKIELPSKKLVYPGIGVDQFDNIYVQDEKLTVFAIAPTTNETFVFEEITLAYPNERLVSRPFSLGKNIVYFATKSGVMNLVNSALVTEKIETLPKSRTEIVQMAHVNVSYRYFEDDVDDIIISAGGPRYWLYKNPGYSAVPIVQTTSFVKYINVVHDHIYYIVNGEKEVNVIQNREKSAHHTIDGIDASNIKDQMDFVIHLPMNDYKTYIYSNIDNSGTIHGLDKRKINDKFVTVVVSTHKLDNVRLICGIMQDGKLYFGTSDGVYELTDIQPKPVIELS